MEPIVSTDMFDREWSIVWVTFAAGWATLLFLFLRLRYLAFRVRCERAEIVEKSPPDVHDGMVILGGIVETDDDGPAIRIEIDQRGSEQQHKGNWSHTWRETARRIFVRPFRLRLGDDSRVLVVPDEKVYLVDDLETETFESPLRKRVAQVDVGERVWIRGVLTREGREGAVASAYRGGESLPVLRRNKFSHLDVSSGSLTVRYARWREFFRTASTVFGVLAVIVHVGFFSPYYLQCLFGRVETAEVTGTHTFTTTHKSSTTRHYVVKAKLSDGKEVDDEVDYSVYTKAKEGKIGRVQFRVVPFARFIYTIGSEPVASIGRTFFVLVTMLVATIILVAVRFSDVPWYEQRRVMEQRAGRMSDGAWDKQVPAEPALFVKGKKKGK